MASDQLTYDLSSDDGCPPMADLDVESTAANEYCYFIEAKQDGETIGLFFFHHRNHIMVDVHVTILKKYRGKLAVEAAKMAFNFMFDLGYMKIQAYIPSFNKPCYFFAKMCGLKDEGISRNSFMKSGQLYNQYIMGLEV